MPPAIKVTARTEMVADAAHEDLMTPRFPAANKLALLLALFAVVAVGFDITRASAEPKRQFDDRGRPYYGASGPNVSYQQGPRTRIYVIDGYGGWDPKYRIKVRVICTRPYHALFMHNMLIRQTAEDEALWSPGHGGGARGSARARAGRARPSRATVRSR